MADEQQDLREVGDAIERLLADVEAKADPHVAETAQEAVRLVVELYGAGLERVTQMLADAGESGKALLSQLAEDNLLASLLVVHDLHPVDPETRVERALADAEATLRAHGGAVELLGVEDGTVTVQVTGSGCGSCPSSTAALEQVVRDAVAGAAPEITEVNVEGGDAGHSHDHGVVEHPTGLIPPSALSQRPPEFEPVSAGEAS